MRQITELSDKESHLAIYVEGGQGWYQAYTTSQWIAQFGHRYDITNKEYVRACSREQIDERTGQIYKLPDGWAAAKHKNTGRIYVYREHSKLALALDRTKKQTASWDSIKIDKNLIKSLRSFIQEAVILDRPVEVKITLYPNGSYKCKPVDLIIDRRFNRDTPFELVWQMELAGAWRKDINVKVETSKILTQSFITSIRDEILNDFRKRCLWCGAYKPPKIRIDARFCQEKHRVYFTQWKKDIIAKYRIAIKRKKFIPEITFSQIVPELLDHDLIMDAISDRLREIQPNLT